MLVPIGNDTTLPQDRVMVTDPNVIIDPRTGALVFEGDKVYVLEAPLAGQAPSDVTSFGVDSISVGGPDSTSALAAISSLTDKQKSKLASMKESARTLALEEMWSFSGSYR